MVHRVVWWSARLKRQLLTVEKLCYNETSDASPCTDHRGFTPWEEQPLNPLAIPEIVIRRIPLYLRTLGLLQEQGQTVTSSQEIGDRLGISATQIRKDLSYFGEFGKQGTGYDVRYLEEQLRRYRIDYRIVGGISFFQRREIKDIVAYLRLVTNPVADSCFERIVNVPARGIGKTTVDRVRAHARVAQIPLLDAADLRPQQSGEPHRARQERRERLPDADRRIACQRSVDGHRDVRAEPEKLG